MFNVMCEKDMQDACFQFMRYSVNRQFESNEESENYLFRHFMDSFCCPIKYGKMFDWFDWEIKEIYGIDIYEYPFDKEKGYSIIKKGNIEIMIYRLENLNKLESIVGDFVGLDDFKLESANTAEQKPYNSIYREFAKTILLPKEYVDFYYKNNPRMDHFYSKEEKRQFLTKWSSNIVDMAP
jgi:hypothetical protein